MGHTGSQCFDEGDRGNWADCWFHGTRVGTRVGHTGPWYPSTRVLTSLLSVCVSSNVFQIATPTVFLWFSQNLAHLIYVPICKNYGTDFRNFDFKFLKNFKWAAELSRPTVKCLVENCLQSAVCDTVVDIVVATVCLQSAVCDTVVFTVVVMLWLQW